MKIMFERFEKICTKFPDRIAFWGSDYKITYSSLLKKVCFYSDLLKKQGSNPVVIFGHKETDFVIAILSCIKAGRTYIPVDCFTPESRLKYIIELTGSDLLINCSLASKLSIESISLAQLIDYKNEPEKYSDNQTAYIIFTSGSTGKPKGVPVSYSNLINFIEWISSDKILGAYSDAVVLNQASFSFDLSVADLFYSLFGGHTLVALTKNDIDNQSAFLDKIIRYKVQIFVVTPTFIRLCLLNPDFNCDTLKNLKCIYFCGEKLETTLVKKLFKRFPDLHIINAYGPTEATSAVSGITISKNMLEDKLLPVGSCDNFATDIFIKNGEIVLSGESVFGGYLGDIKGGYYNVNGVNHFSTGDLGFIKDNMLYCLGRLDNQVKYKGYRIELADIESNILSCEGVIECAVIAIKNKNGDIKYIKAFVVLKDDCSIDYIRSELNKKLPFYMVPKVFSKLQQLPVNDNNKIDRVRLESYD